MTRDELLELVTRITECKYSSEEEADNDIQKLRDNVMDPYASDHIFYADMTPEQIVDKILSYKPIIL